MVNNPFKNLKLSFKLIGGFGSVLLLFILVMVIYNSTIKETTERYDELLSIDMKIAEHAANIENLMLQCRKNEQGFLSHKDLNEHKNLLSNVKKLIDEAKKLNKLAISSGDKKAAQRAEKIIGNINSYKDNFELVVKAYQKEGLDDSSGLKGEFNKIVETFTKDMSLHEVEDIYMGLLKLSLTEKTYLFDKTSKAKKKFLKEIDAFEIIGTAKPSNEVKAMLTELIKDTVPEYRKIALLAIKYVETFNHIEPDNEYVEGMREMLGELLELVSSAYFQGARSLSLNISVNEKNYLLNKDDRYANATRDAIRDIRTAFKESSVEKDYISIANNTLSQYLTTFNILVETDKEIGKLLSTMHNSIDSIRPIVEQLNITAQKNAQEKKESAASRIAQRARTALTIGLLAVLFGILLSYFITRRITKPVLTAVRFARNMAKGDLSQQLEVNSKDEIGILSTALNEMVKNLNTMFSDISTGVDELNASSKSLANVSSELLKGADTTKEKSELVSDSSEKMNSNINSAASAVEQASTSMNLLTETIGNLSRTTTEIAGQADTARQVSDETVQQVEFASSKIGELAAAATDIGAVTDTIADISKQTNLLALNATIESARAGEAGKGFAVVAGEIKTLANQTEDATKAISDKIEGVQKLTENTMTEINKINDIMNNVNEIVINIASGVNEQSKTTHGIEENINQASSGMKDITVVMAENSNVTNEIVSDISDVSKSAQSIAESSHRVNESSGSMLSLGNKLEEMVKKFTL